MKPVRVIAIDDEGPALRRLVRMVQTHPLLNLVGTATNAEAAYKSILEEQPDLVLMDIQLKDATAFHVLSKLDKHISLKIIFITAYDKYAVKAFEFEAIDYLLKPFTEERFNNAIQKIISKNKSSDLKGLLEAIREASTTEFKHSVIPEGAKTYFIENEKLNYIYAEGYYAVFVSGKEKKLIRISLKKLDELLPSNFIRINKSTIVNKESIIELIKFKSTIKVILPDKNEFYVSDSYKDIFREKIHQ